MRQRGARALAGVVAFLALGLASAVALARAPRTPAGMAAGVALMFFCFFAFNKFGFANYYFFSLAAMCCAVGSADLRITGSPTARSRA